MTERLPGSARGKRSVQDLGSADVNELAESFGGLGRLLEAEDDTEIMLGELVAAAVRLVPGAQGGLDQPGHWTPQCHLRAPLG